MTARGSSARWLALAAGALLLSTPARSSARPPAKAPAPLTFAAIPYLAPERMWLLYSPLVDYLASATGQPWRLAVHADHAALLDDLCTGKVDVALLGPAPLARANRRCGAVPFLVTLTADGASAYRSVLLTNDPAVTSVAALRGRSIGFYRGSSAAHVAPMQMLADAGLTPGTYTAVFLESQDRLMSALLSGRIQGTAVKAPLYKRFAREPGLRVLATSAPLPNHAFAALPSLGAEVRGRFTEALLRLRPRERADDAAAVKTWDDEVRNGVASPPPGYLPAVLALGELSERLLRDAP